MVVQQVLKPNLWVDKYADDLFGYAMTKSSSVEQAEYLVQETFLSALSVFSNFKGNSSKRTWLFAILKNKIADHYRKVSTRYEVGENAFKGDESESFLNSFFDTKGGPRRPPFIFAQYASLVPLFKHKKHG